MEYSANRRHLLRIYCMICVLAVMQKVVLEFRLSKESALLLWLSPEMCHS